MQPSPSHKRHRARITGLNDPRIVPYVMIAPFVIYLLCVYLYPTIASVIMSFQRIDGPRTATFIGLGNYSKLMSKNYIMALKTTAWFTVWDVAILIPVPLLFAAMLASAIGITLLGLVFGVNMIQLLLMGFFKKEDA